MTNSCTNSSVSAGPFSIYLSPFLHSSRLRLLSVCFSQGHLKVGKSFEKREGLGGPGGIVARGRRDVLVPSQPHQPNRGVPDRRHHLRHRPNPHPRPVFIIGHIPHVV